MLMKITDRKTTPPLPCQRDHPYTLMGENSTKIASNLGAPEKISETWKAGQAGSLI